MVSYKEQFFKAQVVYINVFKRPVKWKTWVTHSSKKKFNF